MSWVSSLCATFVRGLRVQRIKIPRITKVDLMFCEVGLKGKVMGLSMEAVDEVLELMVKLLHHMCKKSMMRLTLKKNKVDNLHQFVGVATPVVDVNNPSVGTPKGRRKLCIKGGKEKLIEKRFEEH
ncbi:hypothetical protein Tco_0667137 [Tanacetum coccineum]